MAYQPTLNPMPVTINTFPDTVTAGTISATDAVVAAPLGAGATVTGTSTVASYLSLQCPGGYSVWALQALNTFGGGTLYFEGSVDSTTGIDGNWVALNGRQTGNVNTVLNYGMTSPGIYQGNTSSIKWLRVRMVGATTPSVSVIMRVSSGPGAMFLNASIPAGLNMIGFVKPYKAITPTNTQVVSSATTSTLLASNTNRAGATVFNASTAILYLKLGAVASLTSYTVQVAPGGYYEVPFNYTGIIDGIWAAANGFAYVTEVV